MASVAFHDTPQAAQRRPTQSGGTPQPRSGRAASTAPSPHRAAQPAHAGALSVRETSESVSERGAGSGSRRDLGSGAADAGVGLMAYADEAQLVKLREQVAMLSEMGFETTLCQKAVGMFGEDMEACLTWLTDDQAQQAQRSQAPPPLA